MIATKVIQKQIDVEKQQKLLLIIRLCFQTSGLCRRRIALSEHHPCSAVARLLFSLFLGSWRRNTSALIYPDTWPDPNPIENISSWEHRGTPIIHVLLIFNPILQWQGSWALARFLTRCSFFLLYITPALLLQDFCFPCFLVHGEEIHFNLPRHLTRPKPN